MFLPDFLKLNSMDDIFDDFTRPFLRTKPASAAMKTDVKETDQGYELFIDLPGYKKEEVEIELKDGYLTVTATTAKETESTDDNGRFLSRERFYGTCERSFVVGDLVTEEDISAKMEDGVLKITVPKKEPVVEEPVKKTIPIA